MCGRSFCVSASVTFPENEVELRLSVIGASWVNPSDSGRQSTAKESRAGVKTGFGQTVLEPPLRAC